MDAVRMLRALHGAYCEKAIYQTDDGWYCDGCNSEWPVGGVEYHAHDCLARPNAVVETVAAVEKLVKAANHAADWLSDRETKTGSADYRWEANRLRVSLDPFPRPLLA